MIPIPCCAVLSYCIHAYTEKCSGLCVIIQGAPPSLIVRYEIFFFATHTHTVAVMYSFVPGVLQAI